VILFVFSFSKGGDWSKLGVRTGGAPIKGKGKRPVHRPQSAPLHRNPGES